MAAKAATPAPAKSRAPESDGEIDGEIAVDIAIVGGGVAGLALAVTLSRAGAGLTIALIEAGTPGSAPEPGIDARALAITPSSRAMLETLGLWAGLADEAAPVRRIVVTDTKPGQNLRPGLLTFDEETGGSGPLAHMVENRALVKAVTHGFAGLEDIVHLTGAKVTGLDLAGADAVLHLDGGGGGRRVRAGVVAACDGRASAIRALAGIDTVAWAYPQSGIVTTVRHDRPHDGIAREHFMPSGPFAMLPLAGNRSSLVWTEKDGFAAELMAMDEDGFMRHLRARFGGELGPVEPAGPRFAYPLAFHLARAYVRGPVALIGDAAHLVHPLAGLGLNLGFRDIAAFAEVLIEGMRLGLEPRALLADYERWRRFDAAAIALACDGLNRLFSNDAAPLRLARDLGLAMVNAVPAAKRQFSAAAAGSGGEPPRLMRGLRL